MYLSSVRRLQQKKQQQTQQHIQSIYLPEKVLFIKDKRQQYPQHSGDALQFWQILSNPGF